VKKRIVVVLFLVLLVGVSTLVYVGQRRARLEELYYSGTIEATPSGLGFQVPGKVVEVLVDEGYRVERDQVLARLDQAEFEKRLEEAKARVESLGKSLAQLETVREIFQKTLPEDVVRAKATKASAGDVFEDARKNKERYDKLFEQKVVAEKEWDAITLSYETAHARFTEADAALRQAESNLKKIEATTQEIEATRAQLAAAQANRELAEIQVAYTVLHAPFGGIITSRNLEPGEVITPSREVLTLTDLSTVDLKIFVAETEIGKVKPGQDVEVKVDTFPHQSYRGKVAYISPEGEFTPKIIQTHKERVKLVYLVKVSVPNPDLELKSGMPADAWLR
jgi:HlyD family secretion protein